MASSSAAWVLGGVRLISSASRMLVKTGPGRKASSFPRRVSVPVRSEGSMSGVNCTRRGLEAAGPAHGRGEQRLGHPGRPLQEEVTPDGDGDQGGVDHVATGPPPPCPPAGSNGHGPSPSRPRRLVRHLCHDHLPLSLSVA